MSKLSPRHGPQLGRHNCTANEPWKPGYGPAIHPDAKCIHSGDYADTYKCPNCEVTFKVELPE